MDYDVLIIGGGAAGFFTAINIAAKNSALRVAILERGNTVLNKVKVSGGGRCNVTHAEFVPSELVDFYPRGKKELLGPFHQFCTGDTIEWFEQRGVELKIEDDGRMFPVTNSSQTIIDCFVAEADKYGVEILKNQSVTAICESDSNWSVTTKTSKLLAKYVVVASGSNTKIWDLLKNLGHKISSPVPSLFTFNIADNRIKSIPGVVALHTEIKVLGTKLHSTGPLLITHWGLSAPAILKLSAFGAIELAKHDYKFEIEVNFISKTFEETFNQLIDLKQEQSRKKISNTKLFDLPKRLTEQLLLAIKIDDHLTWADSNKTQLQLLAGQLTKARFKVDGKSIFKEEFVTAGGVDLKQVNFKTFESKLFKNMFFAGEVLNIDAVTGGFNFQNAWTSAYIVATAIAKK